MGRAAKNAVSYDIHSRLLERIRVAGASGHADGTR
jgi:hypothetical protein